MNRVKSCKNDRVSQMIRYNVDCREEDTPEKCRGFDLKKMTKV